MNPHRSQTHPSVQTVTALAAFDPAVNAHYPLDVVARLASVSRHRVAVYCRHGFVEPIADPREQGWIFRAEAIHAIRRLEELRAAFGLNLAATRLVIDLTQQLAELRREVDFRRER